MFYGLAVCASLFVLFMKARLLMYKLRKRSSPLAAVMRMTSAVEDVKERLDVHRQHMTTALLYLITACCEVYRRSQLPRAAGRLLR
jgi:hypothetical protein